MEENTLQGFNRCSSPSDLRITDMRFAEVSGAPMDCTILRLDTNQGVVGYGEVRDAANKMYALQLKRLLVGENPCSVEKLFRKIKQFGGHARQGGGVSGVEVALMDLAGKAYGVPVYQMIGGKSHEAVRVYCDTDLIGKNTSAGMGKALKARLAKGYTMLKMDLGVELLLDIPGALNAPADWLERMRKFDLISYDARNRELANFMNVPHPFTFASITELGLDFLDNYVSEIRDTIGYEVPLNIDHIGHVNVESCIRLARRLEKYNIGWMEDCIPWFYTDQWKRLSDSTTVPMCTGEDIYLKENFMPLLKQRAVSVVHPDVLTAGGIMETKKIIDLAEEHGVAAAIHMAETPIGCLAAAHVGIAAGDNFIAVEYHSNDIDWWDSMVKGSKEPIVQNGRIHLSDKPGLGIEELDDEVLKAHANPHRPGLWEKTDGWDDEWSHDRIWS